jgi:hypothetical protein
MTLDDKQNNNEASTSSEDTGCQERRREQARNYLASRFEIKSEFLRVALLSRILGINTGTIYAQMANRSFPMSHFRLGQAIVVKFDDFLDWYCARGVQPQGGTWRVTLTDKALAPSAVQAESQRQEEVPSCVCDESAGYSPAETIKERARRIKAEVRAIMGGKHVSAKRR